MKDRSKKLLLAMIAEYINTAGPVASGFLVEKMGEEISSATVRIEFVQLEKDGYIWQPHTSAGRVPTEKGYRFYLENLESKIGLSPIIKKQLEKIISSSEMEKRQILKNIAKYLAEQSGEAVLLAFEKNDIFYTGLTNLFSQPEFADKDRVIDVTRVIDHLEKVVENLFDDIVDPTIKIGSECPISKYCSAIFFRIDDSLLAIVGPIRMNYSHIMALLNYVSKIKL